MSSVLPSGRHGLGLDESVAARLDADIDELSQGSRLWAAATLAERAELIESVRGSVARSAADWVRTAASIKGLAPDSQPEGEEWFVGPYAVLAGAIAFADSLRQLARGRNPLDRMRSGRAPGGRRTVRVLPRNLRDAVMWSGFLAEVWLLPGVSVNDARRATAAEALGRGEVGLVLGAGNVTSIAPLDVLHELVVNNRAVLLKVNPLLDPLVNALRAAFEPLIQANVLRIVQGGQVEGAYLAHHPSISHVHVTGSAATHDAIVFGTGDDAARRKDERRPVLQKPITSELGGVSPVIVVPGAWSDRDLRYQAEHVASMRLSNTGHNCIAAQVVVLSGDWPQRDAFLSCLRDVLATAPTRAPWYPGSRDRLRAAKDAHPGVEELGPHGSLLCVLPDPDDAWPITTNEYFAPVLGVIELDGSGSTFLDAAVTYANDRLMGSLGANIIIAPSDRRRLGRRFDEGVAALRYGAIGINAWSALGFITPAATWGAFPGNQPHDVGSGIGVVHNSLFIQHAERTVVRGPFRPFPRSVLRGEVALFPKPAWFLTARSAATTGRLLTVYASAPSWRKLPALLLSASRA